MKKTSYCKCFPELDDKELDEKYASVILRRYVEDTGDADGVYVMRNGMQIAYSELVKEVEKPNE